MKLNWPAARTSASLSILFLVVYGATNRLTALRERVPSVYFEWERHTPFIPLIFIPYVSIDVLFIIAPFLARTDRQRRTLALRLAAATILGGLCFLLFPLRFAFDRPPVDGLLGIGFDAFRQMDQPFNQCPSLHVALAAILLPEYLRRFKGVLGLGIALWFTLIVLSAVLTWQHHIIDVAGGFALAALCFYLFQDEPLRKPVTPNHRIAAYYAAGALTLIVLALLARPWSLLLLFPATSLIITTAAYLVLGPGIYRKHNGRVTPLTWLFLWPTLTGQRISLASYARTSSAPWNTLTDQILIGRRLNTEEAQRVIADGVTATLDLTGELNEAPPLATKTSYLNLPILDLTAPTHQQLAQAIAFIDKHTSNPAARVYIHCKLGYSRTAAVIGAWLLHARRAATPDDAIATLRTARPGIIIRPEAEAAIRALCASTRSAP